MGSKIALLVAAVFSLNVMAAVPADKRTLLTSGEKVHTIKYQLGQSTILYFGFRPETIICGNKNYFNIEKIKDAVTVQPLSNLSTNLTVLAQGRRYLFFLAPAGSARPDGFIDVKWVPPSQIRSVKDLAVRGTEKVREIGRLTKLGQSIEFKVLQEHSVESGKRRIFELEVNNRGREVFSTKVLEVVASVKGKPLMRQVLVWEKDSIGKKESVRGRIIVSGFSDQALSLMVGAFGRSWKIVIK